MQNDLLTIDEVILRAKKSGAYLGHGDPKIHLAYLTKLRLLPQTIRRKIGSKIAGCYPSHVLSLLPKIEQLKASGLTYSQIKFQLQNTPQTKEISQANNPSANHLSSMPISHYLPLALNANNSIAFLLIGLILGFLLATNGIGNNYKLAETAAVPPTDNSSQPLVKVIRSDNPSSDPIYLIAIPQQNLYKLGKTDINLLK